MFHKKNIEIDKKFAKKKIVEGRSMKIGYRKIENVNNFSYNISDRTLVFYNWNY